MPWSLTPALVRFAAQDWREREQSAQRNLPLRQP